MFYFCIGIQSQLILTGLQQGDQKRDRFCFIYIYSFVQI